MEVELQTCHARIWIVITLSVAQLLTSMNNSKSSRSLRLRRPMLLPVTRNAKEVDNVLGAFLSVGSVYRGPRDDLRTHKLPPEKS